MKTMLFKKDNEIITLEEIRQWYSEENDCDLPIPDGDMILITLIDLSDSVSVIEDNILEWCNNYASLMECDRFMSQTEKDDSIKDIYLAIMNNDSIIIPEIKRILDDGVKDDKSFVILNREFNKLLSRHI